MKRKERDKREKEDNKRWFINGGVKKGDDAVWWDMEPQPSVSLYFNNQVNKKKNNGNGGERFHMWYLDFPDSNSLSYSVTLQRMIQPTLLNSTFLLCNSP